MNLINSGKIFEKSFKTSVPTDVFLLRLNDPSVSFFQGDNLRFSPTNPFDYLLFKYPFLYLLELKSTEGSLTYWTEDFEDKEKKQAFNIKKNQLTGLRNGAKYQNIIAGFILNFRKNNKTYFIDINQFDSMINHLNKKSFNETDIINSNAYLIDQKLKRVNYIYDVGKFIRDMENIYTYNTSIRV